MIQQLDMFAAAPPVMTPAQWEQQFNWDEHLPVNVERLQIKEKRDHWGLRIDLARHGDSWMWATSYDTYTGGEGYAVHQKWGNFAHDRATALSIAVAEMERRITRTMNGLRPWQREWLRGLR